LLKLLLLLLLLLIKGVDERMNGFPPTPALLRQLPPTSTTNPLQHL
jgi:hypothetical protein